MSNEMSIAKVVLDGETLMDVTPTTATEDTVLAGYKFVNASGVLSTGTVDLTQYITENELEDYNYVTQDQVEELIDSKIISMPGEDVIVDTDNNLSFGSNNPVANKVLANILRQEAVEHFSDALQLYNTFYNLKEYQDDYNINTVLSVMKNNTKYDIAIIAKGTGYESEDYIPDSTNLTLANLEEFMIQPNQTSYLYTSGVDYTMNWRILVLEGERTYYTKAELDEKLKTANVITPMGPDAERLVTSKTVADCINYLESETIPTMCPTRNEVTSICRELISEAGIEYSVKGNNRSATPLITQQGYYYWLRQIGNSQDLSGLWWPGHHLTQAADITFSEMEFVCADGVGFLGYRYRASNSANWTYGDSSVGSNTSIVLGPGTIVQIVPVTLI